MINDIQISNQSNFFLQIISAIGSFALRLLPNEMIQATTFLSGKWYNMTYLHHAHNTVNVSWFWKYSYIQFFFKWLCKYSWNIVLNGTLVINPKYICCNGIWIFHKEIDIILKAVVKNASLCYMCKYTWIFSLTCVELYCLWKYVIYSD